MRAPRQLAVQSKSRKSQPLGLLSLARRSFPALLGFGGVVIVQHESFGPRCQPAWLHASVHSCGPDTTIVRFSGICRIFPWLARASGARDGLLAIAGTRVVGSVPKFPQPQSHAHA